MLFPCARPAGECKTYLIRHVDFPEVTHTDFTVNKFELDNGLELHVVFFPSQAWKVAKSFWQHAGMGVSSRYAEAYLSRVQNIDLQEAVINNSVRDLKFLWNMFY
jgi:cystathionine gamma-synthase